jgi:3-methyl-2-oxobutanoate hydroxymethyltransferase
VQRDEVRLMTDAKAAEQAGAFSIVLECIPGTLAGKITAALHIPTIGIGAGAGCDGQVLVTNDLLGLTSGYVPKFVKAYADLKKTISEAMTRFRDDVRDSRFPGDEQSYR